jgi:hypothetical protein
MARLQGALHLDADDEFRPRCYRSLAGGDVTVGAVLDIGGVPLVHLSSPAQVILLREALDGFADAWLSELDLCRRMGRAYVYAPRRLTDDETLAGHRAELHDDGIDFDAVTPDQVAY